MPARSTYPAWNAMLGGRLGVMIDNLRAGQMSWRRIAELLAAEYGIDVHEDTIRKWWYEEIAPALTARTVRPSQPDAPRAGRSVP